MIIKLIKSLVAIYVPKDESSNKYEKDENITEKNVYKISEKQFFFDLGKKWWLLWAQGKPEIQQKFFLQK